MHGMARAHQEMFLPLSIISCIPIITMTYMFKRSELLHGLYTLQIIIGMVVMYVHVTVELTQHTSDIVLFLEC